MTTGFMEDLQEISDAQKTKVINEELKRLHVNIVTPQETRLASTGSPKEKDYTFFGQGKSSE